MRIGLDIGSTTLKSVVVNDKDEIIYSRYLRHSSQIAQKTAQMLEDIQERFPGTEKLPVCISGSAGMGMAESLGIPFTQEVFATRIAVRALLPDTDAVIELGGEDAKILFLSGSPEVRMNGSCAGGTGAFIDQMATLLGISPDELNILARSREKILTLASRCGVFAKSDLQSLLNQGARKEDIAAGIFYAVVNQTVAGLAQGREIGGKVLYLGGPLTFFSELRSAFDHVLGTEGLCPSNSLFYVAYGAALTPGINARSLAETAARVRSYSCAAGFRHCGPLFASMEEYNEFSRRHDSRGALSHRESSPDGGVWLGIDAGSTTVKCVAVNESGGIVFSKYIPNSGNPVPIVRDFLTQLYDDFPGIQINGSASTGYGEEIIKNAFRLDTGVVETIAHFTAAKAFDDEVDFIIDIGGQDIKCFRIRNGAIDDIFLNEACSSGCGSFLQSFAGALGYNTQEFASLGLFAKTPVDLGSRCTVFMNSSVKQAQKDGADLSCISAGLSISVVKNALYKVVRIARPGDLGNHIVVQGGTFLNDAILRSFELETGRNVTRPSIAGLMGAYGAALFARGQGIVTSGIISAEELKNFSHEARAINCKGCTNNCALTINTFSTGLRFIAGNRCEKPVSGTKALEGMNIYEYKRQLLSAYKPLPSRRGTIGIPMVLNMFEMLPFWHSFFSELGFEVKTSPESSRLLYFKGQHTIPSDTVCYPAKLVHGHIEALAEMGVDAIFYPCLTYNFDEGKGDNRYNCPVVAYYPELIAANVKQFGGAKLIYDYIGIHEEKYFPKKIRAILSKYFPAIPLPEIRAAIKKAFGEQELYMSKIRKMGSHLLERARSSGLPAVVLAGRPYHIDAEVNHGIDQLIEDCGAVVLSEDSISYLTPKFKTGVLNQWTYHARMYSAAKYISDSGWNDLNLVQLVSFGCGVDAVTTDEVRSILEDGGKIYTQIKIDEITNLGAVKIRIRSLFAAVSQQKGGAKNENKKNPRVHQTDEKGLYNPYT